MSKKAEKIIKELKKQSNKDNVAGMARFGINPKNTLGIPMPVLRKMAKETGKDHELSEELWQSGIHEARILACLVAEPAKASERQLEAWAREFDSWDVCDQCCSNFFDRTRFAYKKAFAWSRRKEEFVKRAGFVLMATLAVHDRTAGDKPFIRFLKVIKRESGDERNFVRKAVNWALRQIGKRSYWLNSAAIKAAEEILKTDTKTARWIARDALREFSGETVRRTLQRRAGRSVSRETMQRLP